MQWVGRASDFISKASNNNVVINTFLLGSFGALCLRSMNQQKDIKTLEDDKTSLVKTNKAMKKSMWEWKQQLFAEAAVDGSPIPLSKVKAIYGEASTPKQGLIGASTSEGPKSSPNKFVV